MFHKLLFLGPGGRTVYQGDVDGAKDYFEKLGNVTPEKVNPADFYMDVIGGVTHKGDEEFNPRVLFEAWENHVGPTEKYTEKPEKDADADGLVYENGAEMKNLNENDNGIFRFK